MNIIRLLLVVTVLGLFSGSLDAYADSETTITNNVSVNASTGRNSGEVTQGTSEASMFIETTVNGEVVNFVDEHVVLDSGEPVEVKADVMYEDGESSTTVQIGTTTESVTTEAAPTSGSMEKEKDSFEEESIIKETNQEASSTVTALSNLEEEQAKNVEETVTESTSSALPIAYGLFGLAVIGFIVYAIKLFI